MNIRAFISALSLAGVLIASAAAPAPAATLPGVQYGPRIYKLPYPAGTSYTMCQGNNTGTHTANGQYAWDFCMPIGTPVTASRGGTVKFIRQEFTEAGQGPQFADKNNYVVVDYGDGTSALYMHLMHNGVRVALGQHVDTGQLLAYSGNTGWSAGPHTHFMVMQSSLYDWYTQSLPVAFVDVPTPDGVPQTGGRYQSGNGPLDSALALPPCDQGAGATPAGFSPFWVESFRTVSVWSGQDDNAVQFGSSASWTYFQVLAPQTSPRLQVKVAATGGVAFIEAGAVGPSGPPPANGSCRPSGRMD